MSKKHKLYLKVKVDTDQPIRGILMSLLEHNQRQFIFHRLSS